LSDAIIEIERANYTIVSQNTADPRINLYEVVGNINVMVEAFVQSRKVATI
jgi:hypothetical protein